MRDPVSIDKPTSADSAQSDPRRELVKRIASSTGFQKSNRLRELLLYLCDHALSAPDVTVHEQEIGVEVFGRPANYDTSQDTLVRVQASQLRKKLQQYFAGEGQQEPLIVEIPKGAYTPVFCRRPAEGVEDRPPEVREQTAAASGWKRLALTFAVFALAMSALCAWLVFRTGEGGRRLRPAAGARPSVDRLWRQMFANNRSTCLVLSDSNLTVFEDLIEQQVSLQVYQKRVFDRVADERIKNQDTKDIAQVLMNRSFTSIADAELAGKIGVLAEANGLPSEVIFSRDFTMSYLQSHNAILLGSRRANPWLSLFENQLNFRAGFDEQPPRMAYFQNAAPQAGEQPVYRVHWEYAGYCRVAFLPNLTGNGNVLLITGTDMTSTKAGGEFVTTEKWVQALRARLKLAGEERFPFFEVLLNVELMLNAAPRFEIAAHRTVQP